MREAVVHAAASELAAPPPSVSPWARPAWPARILRLWREGLELVAKREANGVLMRLL